MNEIDVKLINNHSKNSSMSIYITNIHENLLKLGINSTLINMSKNNISCKNNIICSTNFPIFKNILSTIFPNPEIKNLIKNADIVHYSNQSITPLSENQIITVHDITDILNPTNFFLNPLLAITNRLAIRNSKKQLKTAARIITVSEYTKKDLTNILKINPKKIDVVYNGYNKKSFFKVNKKTARKKLKLNNNQKIVLHVGSEAKRKNLEPLIKALSKQKITLIRIGEKTKIIENLAKKYDTKVIWFSNVPEKLLKYYYSAADLFVFPSIYEGFGLAPLEAMACGCPVITTKLTSLPEVCENSAIYLNNPFDENEIKEKIMTTINDQKILNEFSNLGLIQSKKFSWKKSAQGVIKTYKKALSGEI